MTLVPATQFLLGMKSINTCIMPALSMEASLQAVKPLLPTPPPHYLNHGYSSLEHRHRLPSMSVQLQMRCRE